MKNSTETVMQVGVALFVVAAIVFLTMGYAATGLLVSDFAFTAALVIGFWVLVRMRVEAGYKQQEQKRRSLLLAPVRVRR